ncbi:MULTISPECIES: inovirus Gp2 family protein [Alcaligenes]|uniref:inovirus Gp2 family protein n=1 Tax=Alcaligenes TaxID=507 RepID=UPI0024651EEB|nr:inovirus Gp2 family protein [Alcaligenes nematophilus]MDH4867570.1 inovirus Gp2 family protein [Bacillus cereus]MDY7128878.1 inovirus Gp2 family protein [Alcaligenes nematophilus]
MTAAFTYNTTYQTRIASTFNTALSWHKRTTAIRVDLRLPNDHDQIEFASPPITRFFESLKAKIVADINKKESSWEKSLICKVSYVWVREFGPISGKKHFHVLLFLNKDVYYSLGNFQQESGNLSAMIKQAWCSALALPYPEYQQLVHFPKEGVMHVDANHLDFPQQWQRVMEKANYLAKEATKHYGDGERSFGCSR